MAVVLGRLRVGKVLLHPALVTTGHFVTNIRLAQGWQGTSRCRLALPYHVAKKLQVKGPKWGGRLRGGKVLLKPPLETRFMQSIGDG